MPQPPLSPQLAPPLSSEARPLPTPPTTSNARLPYPNSYGPSSTIKPQKPNAHEAYQYGVQGTDWVPYNAPSGRGSTFFVSGSGTQRLGGGEPGVGGGGKRKPLPIPLSRPSTVPVPSPIPIGQPTKSKPPKFTPQTAYSPPSSPQRLPPGAMPPSRRPIQPSSPPPASPRAYQTKMPIGTGSSVMVHSGFWQILAATGSRFVGQTPSFPPGFDDGLPAGGSGAGGALEMFSQRERMVGGEMGARRGATAPEIGGKGRKRLSVDMIGRPGGFTHLVHASDAEQAEDILKRWHIDGVGKLGEPAWVAPIKEAARARARARGVAEVQANRSEVAGSPQPLTVVNGFPSIISSASSTGAAEDDGVSPTTPLASSAQLGVVHEDGDHWEAELRPPSFPEMTRSNTAETIVLRDGAVAAALEGTTRISSRGRTRPSLDGLPASLPPSFDILDPHNLDPTLQIPYDAPKPFVPSLTTIEKAVATKVFFETHYHAILKKPRGRDQRKELLERELARLNISDAERRNVRSAWALSESEYLRDLRKKVNVGSFVKLKTIGHGAFGVVSLVKERGTGELYAMKQLRKGDMLKKGQEGHVRAERDLLATASSSTRWTARLAYSFQDFDHLYLVMTFYSGGDLLTLLIDKDVFEEDFARFYMAEMGELAFALSERYTQHKLTLPSGSPRCGRNAQSSRRYSPRVGKYFRIFMLRKLTSLSGNSIKPDNFLFDKSGHIVISDFGLATDFFWAHDGMYYDQQRRELLHKHGIDLEDGTVAPPTRRFDQDTVRGLDDTPGSVLTMRDRNRRKLAYSVVGTNNYMSVDVLRGMGYDQACDWWSLGVILFEMLYGYPPFVSKSRLQTRQKIMNWRTSLRFPPRPRVSREAQDLISSLLCEKEDRLGSRNAASVSRPNSVITQRRSGFNLNGAAGGPAPGGHDKGMYEGADEIKAHPWFRGIDFATLHLQTPPFVPDLSNSSDTKYFEDDIDDNPLPAPEAAPGQPPVDSTKDPMLRDPVQGAHLLDVRKQLAFQGWTYRRPKRQVYDPRQGVFNLGRRPPISGADDVRGRSQMRSETGSAFGRSLSV
ncbi:hypothetical protein P7C70_g4069, partial [Phenoliferia sp. Uapishka_3]